MTWGDEQKSQRSPDPMVIPTEGPMGTGHQLLGRPTPVLCPGRGTRDARRAARAGGPDPCARAAPTLRRPPSRLNRDPRPSPREPRPRTERGRRRVPEGTDALRVAAGACSGERAAVAAVQLLGLRCHDVTAQPSKPMPSTREEAFQQAQQLGSAEAQSSVLQPPARTGPLARSRDPLVPRGPTSRKPG